MKGLHQKTQKALDLAESFLNHIDFGVINSVYLIGSRAAGTASKNSDWDFLIVGEDFDDVEVERIAQEWRIDTDYETRGQAIDIIFSSKPPKPSQPSIRVI